jgi:hypothetical protein
MVTLDFSGIILKLRKEGEVTRVFDQVRKKWYLLTPEEHVRQYILHYMIQVASYPAAMLAVEKQLKVNNRIKRFDIVVYDRQHLPWLLVECKAPEVAIDENTLYQLLAYNSAVRCTYWLLTNGHQTFCADACDLNNVQWMTTLPAYQF